MKNVRLNTGLVTSLKTVTGREDRGDSLVEPAFNAASRRQITSGVRCAKG